MHYDRIPALLDSLCVDSIAGAARQNGITAATVFSWLVRSRRGDAPLQSIRWMDLTLPFHVHFENSKFLGADAIKKSAMDRALNGSLVPSFFQGRPVWRQDERIVAEGYADADPDVLFLMFGQRDAWARDEHGNRIQERVWLKPSEQLAIKMLEAWGRKRYGQHITSEVTMNSVLRLERPGEEQAAQPAAASPSEAGFSEFEEVTEQPRQLALGPPAKDSADMDRLAAEGAFDCRPVEFIGADGVSVIVQPQAMKQPERKTPDNTGHVPDDDQPDDAKPSAQRRPAAPQPHVGDGVMGYGRGPDPSNVNGARGFSVIR